MQASAFVEVALKKHQQLAGFPFLNWKTVSAHRQALREFWTEVFAEAAGQNARRFHAAQEVQTDNEREIFHVVTHDWQRRIRVAACPQGGSFAIFVKYAEDDYSPKLAQHALLRPTGYLPDRTELVIAVDFDPNRLVAAFEMIRAYTHADIPTIEAGLALEHQFLATYRHIFGFAGLASLDELPK